MSKIARKHRKPEFRTLPSDVKGLEEKRTALIEEMGDMVNKAEAETRTLSEDENKRFGENLRYSKNCISDNLGEDYESRQSNYHF